jgi:predicted esterase
MRLRKRITFLLILSGLAGSHGLCALGSQTHSENIKEGDGAFVPRSGLLLTRKGSAARGRGRGFASLPANDPVRSALVNGTLAQFQPRAGEAPPGQPDWQWSQVQFDDHGALEQRGQYLYVPLVMDEPRVLILHAMGQSETYVNGVPRCGNVYDNDYVQLPILLHRGANSLVFRAGRGSFRVRLSEPPSPVFLSPSDATLPDLVAGQSFDTWGAVVVVNATEEAVEGYSLTLRAPGVKSSGMPIPAIAPITIRKVPVCVQGQAPTEPGDVAATVELSTKDGKLLHSVPVKLTVVRADQPRRVTFISSIDGSVQFFALRQAVPLSADDPPPALVLSCHGAGVDARGQAAAYASKSWCHLVAPTNRRPFGYDWEDFGRMDAMEVLDLAQHSLRYDPARVYVTGHSMGGHGAWHLGVTYPDRFAAVGPSAGWLSRSSYGRGSRGKTDNSPLEALLSRCRNSGDTIALSANLQHEGVYILHGANDDNVPPREAQTMAKVLAQFHHDWIYHEEPGKGHWWGNEYGDGGSACVDWPFMFDLFARHALPPVSSVRDVEFVTADPGISSHCYWLAIEGQIRHFDLSKAHICAWPGARKFQGTTENVAVLRLDPGRLCEKGPLTVELDGQKIPDIPFPQENGALYLAREDGQWRVVAKPRPQQKSARRYGGIKDELKHRFLFVYGTRGAAEENAWAYQKARYDAETFWYRGNGSVDLVPDVAFDPSRYADRTVVLYGNAETNAAWPALLQDSPVQVRRGQVQIGQRTLRGEDLAALFVQPRRDSDTACVVAVSGSGPLGMRSLCPVSLFVPAVRYPDCVITRVDPNDAGSSGNVAAGFFGLDWSVENGEFVFADESENATSQAGPQ